VTQRIVLLTVVVALSIWLLISDRHNAVNHLEQPVSVNSQAAKPSSAKLNGVRVVQPPAQSRDHHDDRSQQALERAVERLAQGARQGLTADDINRRLEDLPPRALATFFERHTHISLQWLHDNGLPQELLSELYRLYALDGSTPKTAAVPAPLGLTRYASGNAGPRYRNVFADINTTIFLHYTVPDTYNADAVIVRWLDADNRSLVHLDRHYLTATVYEVQEAWIRRPKGWAPGEYRVEVFSADSALTPLAAADYRVFRYGED
jgi:hypothetical protein